MKIYGGKDYYDLGMVYGQDPKTVFIRSDMLTIPGTEVPLKVETLGMNLDGKNSYDYIVTSWIVIVFCNKIYRGLSLAYSGRKLYFWNLKSFLKYKEENKFKIKYHRIWRSKVTLENGFDVLPIDTVLEDYMIKNRFSILVDERPAAHPENKGIHANPFGLKKFDFAKALDPYTAYQELSMWISGVLGGQSPDTRYINDDKVLLENHGFDKHSFRSSTRE